MHKRVVSKFDYSHEKRLAEQRKIFVDHQRKNTLRAIGEPAMISAAIKQNFKPVLEMNISKIEREHGYKRKDLYQVYAHFMSIYRLQQTHRKDVAHNHNRSIAQTCKVDYDLFLDNTPIIKYENKEMAQRIEEIIQQDLGINSGKVGFPDFMKYMKLLLAQTFSEKLEVFFETFDLDKNSCFSWDEIYKICHSCLSQMFFTPSFKADEEYNDTEDFLTQLSEYFTKHIFVAVGYGDDLEAEIPFDEMRRVIKETSGTKEGDILNLFCGVDQFTDPV